jgi:hypothetical protein
MSTNPDELRALVEDCNDLNQCDDCGTFVVNTGTHRCPSPDNETCTTRSARRERAERDTRDDDDAVGIFRRPMGHTYAYHELDGEEVCCGCDKYTKATRLDVVTRAKAKSLGRSPCGNCTRLETGLPSDE